MSGTSADGIDACLAAIEPQRVSERAHVHHPFEPALREHILAVARGASLAEAASLDVHLADAYAGAVEALLDGIDVTREEIRAIGCHGQTVLHRPDGPAPTSVQLGDPHRLAALCGIDVVADFRRADIAAGGEGAPLASGFHAAVFADPDEYRCVANLGGMANITLLPPACDMPAGGFDTGPGNVLLDAWIAGQGECGYDDGGTWAGSGTVDEPLLARLLDDPWFRRPPPKSTGRERFDIGWLAQRAGDRLHGIAPVDVQATLAELTAATVAEAVLVHAPATARLLVCGGGAHNTDLLRRIARRLSGIGLETTAEHGIDPGHVEALAFAWLAWRRLHDLPGNCPAVTGASRAVPLGAVIRGPR